MADTKRALTVYIGRFSPFHNGHAATLERALRLSERVLVIIGSAFGPRDIKNPWSYEERHRMIMSWANVYGPYPNLSVVGQQDHPYNNQKWLADIQQHVWATGVEGEVYLTGADRDDSTFYLKQFPQFKQDLVEEDTKVSRLLSATSIRDLYFGQTLNGRQLTTDEVDKVNGVFLPQTTTDMLSFFRGVEAYENLVEEYRFQQEHDRKWSAAPYTPTFNTVDAVVVQTGHVLLVRRRNAPGRGLWALPGGYLKPSEWMVDSAVRELVEETKIDVPKPVLYGSIKGDQVFDAPGRSCRGRVITRAFLFKLPDHVVKGRLSLPKVKGSDDAAKAKWFPLADLRTMRDKIFEDHHTIIETLIAKLNDNQ